MSNVPSFLKMMIVILLCIAFIFTFTPPSESPEPPITYKDMYVYNLTPYHHMVGKISETDYIMRTDKGNYTVGYDTYKKLAVNDRYNFTMQSGCVKDFEWIGDN
jgi:hypothetical protein